MLILSGNANTRDVLLYMEAFHCVHIQTWNYAFRGTDENCRYELHMKGNMSIFVFVQTNNFMFTVCTTVKLVNNDSATYLS